MTAQLAISEALVARATELCGARTADRLVRIEAVRDQFDDGGRFDDGA